MPVGITIEYAVGSEAGVSTQRIAVALERAGDNMAQFGRYVFPRLISVFEKEVKAQFDAEGQGAVSGGWAELSDAYAAWKEDAFPGKSILRRTDALYDALTNSGSPGALRDYSATDFNYGTQGIPYAAFHQLGTRRMPARPPFDFRPEVERAVIRAAAAGLREAIKEADPALLAQDAGEDGEE